MTRLLIKYGSHGQYECLVAISSLGIVCGKLVRGFTRTGPNSFIYGKVLENAQIIEYFS